MNVLSATTFLLVTLCMFGATESSRAQSNREELLAKGGVQLNGEELKQLLSGRQISGPTFDGNALAWSLKSDGSFSGYGQNADGRLDHSGTWVINERGQFCFQNNWYFFGARRDEACQDWFRLGSDLFAIRDGQVLRRKVE